MSQKSNMAQILKWQKCHKCQNVDMSTLPKNQQCINATALCPAVNGGGKMESFIFNNRTRKRSSKRRAIFSTREKCWPVVTARLAEKSNGDSNKVCARRFKVALSPVWIRLGNVITLNPLGRACDSEAMCLSSVVFFNVTFLKRVYIWIWGETCTPLSQRGAGFLLKLTQCTVA